MIGAVIIPLLLHLLPGSMPWWPDTVSIGVGFGVVAVASAWRIRKDREMNPRIWNAIKPLFRRKLNRTR